MVGKEENLGQSETRGMKDVESVKFVRSKELDCFSHTITLSEVYVWVCKIFLVPRLDMAHKVIVL